MSEIGEILRSARLSQSRSILDAARATRIKPAYLEALENGEYALLPGPAYVTGFLRNYASYLGLHPDDVVQEYYAVRPPPQPSIRAATRVLASGYDRQMRRRVLWTLSAILVLLAGGFAIKQYNDTYAHASPQQINVTPANLGLTHLDTVASHAQPAKPIYLHLRSLALVWVRVTVDGRRSFQGILRPEQRHLHWKAHHSIYVITYDGSHLRVTYDGRFLGRMATQPGLLVYVATPHGWHRAA